MLFRINLLDVKKNGRNTRTGPHDIFDFPSTGDGWEKYFKKLIISFGADAWLKRSIYALSFEDFISLLDDGDTQS